MEWTEKETQNLKLAMMKKYGKTSIHSVAQELSISRQTIYKILKNSPYTEKQRENLRKWVKNSLN